MKCLQRDFDDEGRMFFCELPRGHRGRHFRLVKIGYRRAYVIIGKVRTTFAAAANPQPACARSRR